MSKAFAISVIRRLRENKHQAYLVGGCVRDLLLGYEPADFDVTTSVTPDEVMRIFPETYAVGAQFGVVLVPEPASQPSFASSVSFVPSVVDSLETSVSNHGEHRETGEDEGDLSKRNTIEVATFRADLGYSDGRHPDHVRFSQTPQEDVVRRDFTINGLLLDPITEDGCVRERLTDGVLDFVGGRKDIEAKLIRTIGEAEKRFEEDKLRMLRGVRFAARLGYAIEPETLAAMQKLAPKIHQVSRERVREELTKMLTEGHARRAFELLDQAKLLHEVLPEIEAMKGVDQPPQFHPEGDVFVHTLMLLEKLPHPCAATLAWGALLHDVGKPPTFRVAPDRIRFDGHVEVGVKMTEEICRRLRFSNSDAEQILSLVKNHMRFASVRQMKESTFKKFIRMPDFDEHLQLHRMDCESSNGILDSYNFTREKMRAMPPEAIRPAPLLSGDDLLAAGYAPGPRFKEILSAVEDAQLEGKLATKEVALEFVRSEFQL